MVPEELHCVAFPLTLLRLGIEAMFPQPAQDFADMVLVLRMRGRKDEEIVEVYNQGDIQEVSKDRVHESLEGRWGVGEAEWHDEEFEGAVTCAEGHLPLIPVFNV